MSNDTRSRPMTAETIHTCSYYCERPGCVRAQRDELVARLTTPPSAPEPEVHSYDPTDQRESVTIRWPDGKCLSYVLDRTRYTDNLPPSAPVGVDGPDAQAAEIESLRAEVAEWKRVAAAQAELHGEAEDRAERLAEALREWWSAHRPVGWTEDQHRACPYVNLATATDKALAEALLRDQEEGHE